MTFRQGEIIRYPYLWQWQAERDETEGRKERPVCVALPLAKAGLTHLFLLALTTTPPKEDQAALAVPDTEMRRAGLDPRRATWVILSECNYDVLERSYYIDHGSPPTGRFSEAFTSMLKVKLRDMIQRGSLNQVQRAIP